MFDIDHFKRINDTYGHDAGDLVIRRVAGEAATMPGLVGRLGGEEFAIVLQGLNIDRAFQAADSLRQRYSQLDLLINQHPIAVTCSFGVSSWKDGWREDELLNRADIALYQAKKGGRNRVVMREC